MRALDFELQRPENACARERDDRTHLRRVLPPLRRRPQALVEEGVRTQKTEEVGPRCVFAVLQIWVSEKEKPGLVPGGHVGGLVPAL